MNETVTALLSVFTGSAMTILAQWLTQQWSERHESRKTAQEAAVEVRARFQALYEDALCVLERNEASMGLGDTAALEANNRLHARMSLLAPPAVRDQSSITGKALDAWAAEARQAYPSRGGAFTVISTQTIAHEKEADKLWPAYAEAFEKLRQLMREHLETLG